MAKRGRGYPSDNANSVHTWTSLLGKFAPSGPPRRVLGFPPALTEPLFLWTNDKELKAHQSYQLAKAGDAHAAIDLVSDLAQPLLQQLILLMDGGKLPTNPIYVAPHAREAKGDNAIPQVLAVMLSIAGGELDEEIVQTTKVYHTGADAMERLISRASFHGAVYRGRDYILVDDVTTLGGTLCDLTDHIETWLLQPFWSTLAGPKDRKTLREGVWPGE